MTSLPSHWTVFFGTLASTRMAFAVVLTMGIGLGMLSALTGCSKGSPDSAEQQDDDPLEYDEVTKALTRKVTVLSAKKLLGKLSDEQEEDLANAKALLELRRRVRRAHEQEAKEEAAQEQAAMPQAAQVHPAQQPPVEEMRFWQGLADLFRSQLASQLSQVQNLALQKLIEERIHRDASPAVPAGSQRGPQQPPTEEQPVQVKKDAWAKQMLLGVEKQKAGRLEDALSAYYQARDAIQDVVEREQSDGQAQFMLSQSHHAIGTLRLTQRVWEDAERSYVKELQILQTLQLQGKLTRAQETNIAAAKELLDACRKAMNR